MSDQGDFNLRKVIAVLGPTNTGKTYLAMDRLLSHNSGIIGFPLRLLARENYERAIKIKSVKKVALITGEEKIIPPNAKYFICTVESMPLDKQVEFVAVDEIQLAADRERGHVFTDRILHSRGLKETMFLGSETITDVVRRLVPHVVFVKRPRFSKLRYSGLKNITKLPKRTAIVAFSVAELYGIADLLRRKHGGTAVVMGALSPRTRNAQVSLYQSGEVDYMVATDAIGMGLNMDVNHVAFSSLAKFDGKARRRLGVPELSQIAGRAGRFMNDGTFGVTGEVNSLEPELVSRIENHHLPSIDRLFWRNTELTYSSVKGLISGLRSPPVSVCLRPSPGNDDYLNLEHLILDELVVARAVEPDNIKLLWEVAQIPDFRKARPEMHSRFLLQLYDKLTSGTYTVPEDWIGNVITLLSNMDGDINTLMDRIAAVRTWNYIVNRPNWLDRSDYWQLRVREVEDNISDVLHQKLTQQFIDQRTSYLMNKNSRKEVLAISITSDDQVYAGPHYIGNLQGFVFQPDDSSRHAARKIISTVSREPIIKELQYRAKTMCREDDTYFSIDSAFKVCWRDSVVGFVTKGTKILEPKVKLQADEALDAPTKGRLTRRLQLFLDSHVEFYLKPLIKMHTLEMTGAPSGLLYQLTLGLGTIATKDAKLQVKGLTVSERKIFSRYGVRFGIKHIYVTHFLKPASVALRGFLWSLFHDKEVNTKLLDSGRVSMPVPVQHNDLNHYYLACGFYIVHNKAYRVDALETFLSKIRKLQKNKISILPSSELSPLGINSGDAIELLNDLGLTASSGSKGISIGRFKKKHTLKHIKPWCKGLKITNKQQANASKSHVSKEPDLDPDSPFFSLKKLLNHGR